MSDTPGIFDAETTSTILKWAITILAAGFIAQFGKKIADYLTEKARNIRKKKKGRTGGSAGTVSEKTVPGQNPEASGQPHNDAALKARLKLEKKAAKAKEKQMKKMS